MDKEKIEKLVKMAEALQKENASLKDKIKENPVTPEKGASDEPTLEAKVDEMIGKFDEALASEKQKAEKAKADADEKNTQLEKLAEGSDDSSDEFLSEVKNLLNNEQ